MKKLIIVLICMLFVVEAADAAKRRKRRARRAKLPIINEPMLYERLGGLKILTTVSASWAATAMADERLSSVFNFREDSQAVKDWTALVNQKSCLFADGGEKCHITKIGTKANKAMAVLRSDDDLYLIFSDLVVQELKNKQTNEREINEFLAAWGEYPAENQIEAAQ